ncbi:MAG: DMT family protein [Bacteroidales bacterium]|nr:DMT family protein [Bacteroidales bacterium]
MNKFIYTIIFLIIANVFMTLAWYGHLKMSATGLIKNWPLIAIILVSWGIAFIEYCFQIPANKIGFQGNGGPYSLMQLKVLQEVISISIFIIFSIIAFKNESIRWNHIIAFVCIILAVYFVFKK